jgi:hypothetical protein
MEDGKILEVYDNSSVPDFYEALARLRNQAGTQIGWLVRQFNLDVEDQLSQIIPSSED